MTDFVRSIRHGVRGWFTSLGSPPELASVSVRYCREGYTGGGVEVRFTPDGGACELVRVRENLVRDFCDCNWGGLSDRYLPAMQGAAERAFHTERERWDAARRVPWYVVPRGLTWTRADFEQEYPAEFTTTAREVMARRDDAWQTLRDQMRAREAFVRGRMASGLWEQWGRLSWAAPENPEAKQRAMDLLREHLDEEQAASLDTNGHFEVVAQSGRRYRITTGRQMNVYELGDDGEAKRGLCFVPDGGLAEGDVMLAQKVMLETNEQAALDVAVVFGDPQSRRAYWYDLSRMTVFRGGATSERSSPIPPLDNPQGKT